MTLQRIAHAVRETKSVEADECMALAGMAGTETLTCLGCQQPFVILRRRGNKPNYCNRNACRQARANAERGRNAAAKRESAERERMRGLVDSLFENDEVRLRHREVLEVCEILQEFKPTQDSPRLELKRFVLVAARAKGQAPWRRALLELAACAIFLASQYNSGVDKKAMVQ